MEPAVGELVHGRQVEVAELDELAGAREVEEPVTADLAGDVPEQQAEHGAGGPHPRAPGDLAAPRGRRSANGAATSAATRSSTSASVSEAWTREDDRHRGEDDPEAPGERRRGAPHARPPARRSRPARARARSRRASRTSRKTELIARSASARRPSRASGRRRGTSPPSRRGRSCRGGRRAVRSSERTLSASSSPWCLRKKRMWPAQVVTVEPAAVRGAADVHALRLRREERLPARLRRSGSTSRPPR